MFVMLNRRTLVSFSLIAFMSACGPGKAGPAAPDEQEPAEAVPKSELAPEPEGASAESSTPAPVDPGSADADPAGVAAPPTDLAAVELEAYGKAKPVFQKYCAGCHTTAAKYRKKKKALMHFSMDDYPFGGHHAHELGTTIPKVLGVSGKKPTMPLDDPGAVAGEDLALVLAWAQAFEKAHESDGMKHGHGMKHDHGKKKKHDHGKKEKKKRHDHGKKEKKKKHDHGSEKHQH